MCNRARRTKKAANWDLYKEAQKEYKNKINKYKQEGWRDFCGETNKIPKMALLHKILAKNTEAHLGTIRLESGEFASNEEECLN